MTNLEVRAISDPTAKEQSPAQILIDKVLQGLGRDYFAESKIRIVQLKFNPHQQFAYHEIQIKERGRLTSRRSFMGARAFFTLFADGGFIREIELNDKKQDKSPAQNIEGYTMGDGDLSLQIGKPARFDIPKNVRQKLNEAGAEYFPTTERYLYRNDTSSDLDKVADAFERSI